MVSEGHYEVFVIVEKNAFTTFSHFRLRTLYCIEALNGLAIEAITTLLTLVSFDVRHATNFF